METIVVEIYVPSISASFDFRLPGTGRVCDVTDEMIRVLELTHQNLMLDHEHPILYDAERNIELAPEQCIAETGVRDSSRLILV